MQCVHQTGIILNWRTSVGACTCKQGSTCLHCSIPSHSERQPVHLIVPGSISAHQLPWHNGIARHTMPTRSVFICCHEHDVAYCWLITQVVYEWAAGTPFAEICTLTDVMEGSIVRTIVRLDQAARELQVRSQ